MKTKLLSILYFIPALIILASCSSSNNKSDSNNVVEEQDKEKKITYIFQSEEQVKELKSKAAKIAKTTQYALGKKLKGAISEGGLEHAISFCNIEAMDITDSLSKLEGVTIRRLAKKNRNPLNATNDEESEIFKQFVIDYLSNVRTKPVLTANHNGNPVYFQLIRTQDMCLTCHGKPGETIPTNIAEKIKELYPEDKAINFEEGHPRGMWEITFNEIELKSN